jgi:hypothetical protein
MISESLNFISKEIILYLNDKIIDTQDIFVLGDVAQLSNNEKLKNKIILSLVNVEEDHISRNPENFVKIDNKVIYKNPTVNLNLYCLFSVFREEDYAGALKRLSLIVQFFQHKNVFTHENSPSLHQNIEKLIFDLHNLSFEKINHLWSILGGKYIPSVMYKMRLVRIDEGITDFESKPIKEINIEGRDFPH